MQTKYLASGLGLVFRYPLDQTQTTRSSNALNIGRFLTRHKTLQFEPLKPGNMESEVPFLHKYKYKCKCSGKLFMDIYPVGFIIYIQYTYCGEHRTGNLL